MSFTEALLIEFAVFLSTYSNPSATNAATTNRRCLAGTAGCLGLRTERFYNCFADNNHLAAVAFYDAVGCMPMVLCDLTAGYLDMISGRYEEYCLTCQRSVDRPADGSIVWPVLRIIAADLFWTAVDAVYDGLRRLCKKNQN
jgi:hypothetical protein